MRSRLIRWLPVAAAPVLVAGAVAIPLAATAAPTLPERTPQQVLALIADAADLDGYSGEVRQTSDLGLPELPSTGAGTDTETASVLELLTGDHEARVWFDGPAKARVAVLDDMGERDLVANGDEVWLWDSEENTAVRIVGQGFGSGGDRQRPQGAPTPAEAAEMLIGELDPTTAVTVDAAQTVAGRDAYTLVLTPRAADTTVGSIRLAVDAETGLPLRTQVFAQGAGAPAFEVGFTSLDLAVPDADIFTFSPPPGAEVTTKRIDADELRAKAQAERSDAPSEPTAAGPRPEVTGEGWDAVVELPAGSASGDVASNPTFQRLTTAVDGGRVLATNLVNVLITDGGRVFAGAVPVERLQAASAG